MDPLYRQSTVRAIWGTILFIVLIFGPAGTFHYWQGWLFLAVFAATTTAFTVYLALYDKPLLERRLQVGKAFGEFVARFPSCSVEWIPADHFAVCDDFGSA